MGITRMNHAVLYVRDARRQQRFYAEVLGFRSIVDDPDGQYVFMRAPDSLNHHDIAFFTIGDQAGPSEAGARTVGMYHIAWEVRSLDVTLRLSIADDVSVDAPLLLTDTHWFTHGFGDDLDAAMAMAAEQALRLLVDRGGFTMDEAYSVASVAVDFGVTQVVDGRLGCHAAITRALLDPQA